MAKAFPVWLAAIWPRWFPPRRVTNGPRPRTLEGYAQRREELFHVVAYDFGVKRNILRMLAERGVRLTVVPAQTPAADVIAMNPDGVFLSNGPGDPEPCAFHRGHSRVP